MSNVGAGGDLVSVSVVEVNDEGVLLLGESVGENSGSSDVELSLGVAETVESCAAGVFTGAG